jgi:hypothetical protein
MHRAGTTLLAAVTAAGIFVGLDGCRDPTQVTVDIRTLGIDCTKELRHIGIAVARNADIAEETMGSSYLTAEVTSCDGPNRVGTLVVTPETGTGAIVVAASYSGVRCQPPKYEGCIVARRRFSFVEHTKLTLPITLEASCRDVPCNTFSSCRSGTCTNADSDCSNGDTCVSPAEPIIGNDGKPIPPDAGDVVDGGNDGGAPTDAGGDANDGGSVTTGGNACPPAPPAASSSGGFVPGPDCHPNGCCGYMFFSCATVATGTCTMGAPVFSCTGRKHCGAGYCCGRTGAPSVATCMGDPTGCNLAGYVPVCNNDGDCPAGLHCTGIFQMRSNGNMKSCQP